jgi:enterochelin esterase-like enzyme
MNLLLIELHIGIDLDHGLSINNIFDFIGAKSPGKGKPPTRTTAVRKSFESGWADLNRRPPRPKRGALPTALHPESGCEYNACMLNRQAAGTNRPQRILLIGVLLVIILTLAACIPSQVSPTPARDTSTPTAVITLPVVQTASPSATAATISTATTTQKPACTTQKGTVSDVSLDTTFMYASAQFQVYLPPCYQQEVNREYPLLILFHGIYDDNDQWLRIGAVESADRLIISAEVDPFIIVMPYDPNPRGPSATSFDEVFLQDMLPYIEANYRVASGLDLRALGGVSRGAGWAIHFGFLYPDLFGTIGAHSPIIFNEDYLKLAEWLGAIPAGTMPRISMDIGDHDPNREAYERLEAFLADRSIPFEAYEYPGYHNETYWRSQVESYIRWYSAGW